MAILKNCEIWFARVTPEAPNKSFDKENPSWEVQLRTADPIQKQEWSTMGLKPKLMVFKEGDPQEGEPILNAEGRKQYKCMLKRKTKSKDLSKENTPVKVIDGNFQPIDPRTIGNGSIANIKVYQYEYGTEGKVANILQEIQITKHIVYKPVIREEFEPAETETINLEDDSEESEDSDNDDDSLGAAAPAPAKPSAPPKPLGAKTTPAVPSVKKPQVAQDFDDDIPY